MTQSTDDLPDDPRELIETIKHRYGSETPSLAKGSIQGGAEFVRSGFSATHFPLELLQNADDEQAGDILFEFDSAHKQLRVFDDGTGFDKTGVISVCQQGQSRKDHDKQIGFRGIGFKSLFEVCDRVEIHSNGYHFAFDLTADETGDETVPGFLLPEWIDPDSAPDPKFTDETLRNDFETAIVGNVSTDDDEMLSALQSENFSPSVFLFLNNLERARIRSDGPIHRTLVGEVQAAADHPNKDIRQATSPDADALHEQIVDTELDAPVQVRTIDDAERAKSQRKDPETEVEIPIAQDMADRIENILGIAGVAERVRELEGEMTREEAVLALAADFAEGRVGDYDTNAGKIEGAVRTAVALLTESAVAAAIEGIDKVELLENDDGTEFVNVYYAGPIRSAGSTAQSLSVLVADYTRSILGIAEYNGRESEIERYVEEINLYDTETGLQYSPKNKETRFMACNMPIMLDGEATGDDEVSGYRDLERVDTNAARGGMCLVMAEGISLKAPKIQRYARQLSEVEWPWLEDILDGTIGETADDEAGTSETAESTDDEDASDE